MLGPAAIATLQTGGPRWLFYTAVVFIAVAWIANFWKKYRAYRARRQAAAAPPDDVSTTGTSDRE